MKSLNLPTLATLFLTTAIVIPGLFAQDANDRMTVRRAAQTIDAADATYREREAEVLGDDDEADDLSESEAAIILFDSPPPPPPPPPAPEREVEVITLEPPRNTDNGAEAGPIRGLSRELPELPRQTEFRLPEGDVLLELPGADPQSTAISADAETISVDFPDEDVRDIIRSVAELYELNVVIPETLQGNVTIKLRNVTWQQVFGVVLEPLGFTYIIDGNIIKIKSMEELALEPVDTRVFIIDFAVAQDISGSVGVLVDGSIGGRVVVDKRSNALVITERPSRMNAIQEIIETLDRPTEQVMIESKFVEILVRDGKNVGVDWASLSGYAAQAGPFNRLYESERGRERESIDSNLTDFNLTNTDGVVGTNLNSQTLTGLNNTWTNDFTNSDTAVFSADAFRMVISALETNSDVELVSNPTVVTMNNMAASINIGEKYPVPSYTYNTEIGRFEISGFEDKDIGINLNVTPQINSAGFINLKIEPEISSRSGEVSFGGASGTTIPIISSRRTQSTVSIKSGYTLAIGGLIEQTTENTSTKVPVLGSIPGVGRLFSSSGKSVDRRNLIIFITAKILSASGATYRDVFSQRTLYEMGIKARDLPGYEPPPSERELFDNISTARNEIDRLDSELKLRQQLEAFDRARGKTENKISEQEAKAAERSAKADGSSSSSSSDRVIPRRGR